VSTAPPATWRAHRSALAAALAEAGVPAPEAEARWITETVAGCDAAGWLGVADAHPSARAIARVREMAARRCAGVPLQYVLGAWSFCGLDLMVDERVLIPRPETEVVVEVALEEAVRSGLRRGRRPPRLDALPAAVVADLGTGSGAIALALEAELPDAEVWATDVSPDALAVARANVAGCAATGVRVALGSWFDALPPDLCGRLSLVVSNPPYVADGEPLPREVVAHEPPAALFAGPTGLEAIDVVVDGALTWLSPGCALVCELAPHQADAASARARARGYADVEVRSDLAGRPRVLVARRERGVHATAHR
jgi:release factor glutamine methyltransferase